MVFFWSFGVGNNHQQPIFIGSSKSKICIWRPPSMQRVGPNLHISPPLPCSGADVYSRTPGTSRDKGGTEARQVFLDQASHPGRKLFCCCIHLKHPQAMRETKGPSLFSKIQSGIQRSPRDRYGPDKNLSRIKQSTPSQPLTRSLNADLKWTDWTQKEEMVPRDNIGQHLTGADMSPGAHITAFNRHNLSFHLCDHPQIQVITRRAQGSKGETLDFIQLSERKWRTPEWTEQWRWIRMTTVWRKEIMIRKELKWTPKNKV